MPQVMLRMRRGTQQTPRRSEFTHKQSSIRRSFGAAFVCASEHGNQPLSRFDAAYTALEVGNSEVSDELQNRREDWRMSGRVCAVARGIS